MFKEEKDSAMMLAFYERPLQVSETGAKEHLHWGVCTFLISLGCRERRLEECVSLENILYNKRRKWRALLNI